MGFNIQCYVYIMYSVYIYIIISVYASIIIHTNVQYATMVYRKFTYIYPLYTYYYINTPIPVCVFKSSF